MIGRRELLKAGAAAAGTAAFARATAAYAAPEKHSFKLKYAPHLSLFGYIEDEVDRLNEVAAYGFKAFEYNGLKGWPLEKAERLRKKMDELGLEMGVFTANPAGWNKTGMVDPEQRPGFLDEVKEAMNFVDITGNKYITVITGAEMQKIPRGVQRANVVESLRRAADIAAPHKVTLVMEPLNILVNHAGYYLSRSDEAYEIIRAVDNPHARMLFDIYHQQITEGNLIENIRNYRNEIGTFHVGDVPGRHQPGTGEINYKNVFKAIHELKMDAYLGLEFSASENHGKREGAEMVVQSIVDADGFDI